MEFRTVSFIKAIFFSLLLLAQTQIFSQEKAPTPEGFALSEHVEGILKRAGYQAQRSPLASVLFEDFPFNMELDFPSKGGSDHMIILSIKQEDAAAHKDFVSSLLEFFEYSSFPLDIRVLFTAGDEHKIAGNDSTCGTESFCRTIGGAQNIMALVLDFGAQKGTYVTPGSGGEVSPLYLTRLLCESLDKNGAPYKISGGIFLALYKTGVLRNRARLSSFLTKGIPAVMLSLKPEEKLLSNELNAVKDFFSSVDAGKTENWGRHYIPVKISSRRFWIEEDAIIYSVIVFVAAALFIISDFSFLFRKRSRRLAEIKARAIKSTYLIFVTAAILTLSFFLGQALSRLFQAVGQRNAMVLFLIKLTPAFFIVSLLYPIELKIHKNMSTYVYEYILTISAVVNIFIFSLIDISLFYIFALEYIVVISSRPVKKTPVLYVFMALTIAPFIPLIHSILLYSDGRKIYSMVFSSAQDNLLLSFALVPFNLLWLRILANLHLKASSPKNLVVRYTVTAFVSLMGIAMVSAAVVFVLNGIFFRSVEVPRATARIIDSPAPEFSSAQVYDTEYYGGKIRHVEIEFSSNAQRCSVLVLGQSENPISFSIFETEEKDGGEYFLLPDNPPKKINIIYTPDSSAQSSIIIDSYFMEENPQGQKRQGRPSCKRERILYKIDGGNISRGSSYLDGPEG